MKIFHVTFHDKEVMRKMYEISGKPYGFWASLRRGGSGTPRGVLQETPDAVTQKFENLQSTSYCSFQEMRRGILLSFNRRQEAFSIPIPFSEIERLAWKRDVKNGRKNSLELLIKTGEKFVIQYDRGYFKAVNNLLGRLPL
jgi:hypothetical protein